MKATIANTILEDKGWKHTHLKTRWNIGIRINSHIDNKFCSLVGSTRDNTKMQKRIVITIAADIIGTYWKWNGVLCVVH